MSAARIADAPVLETERLVLRAPDASDAAAFIGFCQSARARFIGGPMTAENAWMMLATVMGHWLLKGFGLWVMVPRGQTQAIGTAGCLHPPVWPEGEISWHLWNEADEGKGLAAEAVRAVRGHAYDALGWKTAVSYIVPRNTRSIKLAERLGAERDSNARHPLSEPAFVYRHPSPEVAP